MKMVMRSRAFGLLSKPSIIRRRPKWQAGEDGYFGKIYYLQRARLSRIPGLLTHRSCRFESSSPAFNDVSRSSLLGSSGQQQRSLTTLSRRDLADLEDRVRSAVGTEVKDPLLKQPLDSLDWIHRRMAVSEDGTLQILLKLPSLLHPSVDELKGFVKDAAERQLKEWQIEKNNLESGKVNVEIIATKPVSTMARLIDDQEDLLEILGPGLENVSHILAVYSCKGGVGKSTVAINLAYEMARMGGRIGLLDVDIHGPSLPVLVQPDDLTVRQSPKGRGMVYPIEHRGVKMLSLGFVSKQSGVPGSGKDNGATVMRGPAAATVVTQLLKGTDWGELDVLILDMPPGTGDVQLAVCQDLQLSGAVAVTTPSKLAEVDTRRGMEMFTSLGVPTLAVVENLSYFECEGGGKHFPFGKGLSDKAESFGTTVIQLPISTITNDANDTGSPLCLCRSKEAVAELSAFEKLAKTVSGEFLKLQYENKRDDHELVMFGTDVFDVWSVHLALDKGTGDSFTVRLHSDLGALQLKVSSAQLRSRDPKTGEALPDSPFKDDYDGADPHVSSTDPSVTIHRVEETKKARGKKSPSLKPSRVQMKGRYGYAVVWADGATIIYSKLCIARAAGGIFKE